MLIALSVICILEYLQCNIHIYVQEQVYSVKLCRSTHSLQSLSTEHVRKMRFRWSVSILTFQVGKVTGNEKPNIKKTTKNQKQPESPPQKITSKKPTKPINKPTQTNKKTPKPLKQM